MEKVRSLVPFMTLWHQGTGTEYFSVPVFVDTDRARSTCGGRELESTMLHSEALRRTSSLLAAIYQAEYSDADPDMGRWVEGAISDKELLERSTDNARVDVRRRFAVLYCRAARAHDFTDPHPDLVPFFGEFLAGETLWSTLEYACRTHPSLLALDAASPGAELDL